MTLEQHLCDKLYGAGPRPITADGIAVHTTWGMMGGGRKRCTERFLLEGVEAHQRRGIGDHIRTYFQARGCSEAAEPNPLAEHTFTDASHEYLVYVSDIPKKLVAVSVLALDK